jgi:RHH-type proline utilization regulon transcriptional repressor/proline dehydrogenase/delta 1-pyrroline-5-carboxylate dehydrogenase
VVVLDAVHQAFSARLVEAARSLRIGPAEDPANYLGALIDGVARDKVRSYIEVGRGEGTPLLLRDESPGPGYYAPLAIFDDITPSHRLAREEIFGPVLSVMRAGDFSEALETANSTPYALTGAVFSRSPRNLERAARDFRVGNLYLNRGCTGALVSRQPFGGFGMSGIGSKAGGPDYLMQFLDPRTVTENTMRRGFAPSPEE